jgi:hypothetical protein|tara:strand:- start:722 stop:1012 length:291 start_codon:yes stop_codon:yes gene_type:complete
MADKEYDFVATGFGATAQEAQEEAEKRLPYSPNEDGSRYAAFQVMDPVGVEGDQLKVEIQYSTRDSEAQAQAVKQRSSSAGPTDTFASTRTLDEQL